MLLDATKDRYRGKNHDRYIDMAFQIFYQFLNRPEDKTEGKTGRLCQKVKPKAKPGGRPEDKTGIDCQQVKL